MAAAWENPIQLPCAGLAKLLSILAGLVGLGPPLTPALLRLEPIVSIRLRSDPRFQKLVASGPLRGVRHHVM